MKKQDFFVKFLSSVAFRLRGSGPQATPWRPGYTYVNNETENSYTVAYIVAKKMQICYFLKYLLLVAFIAKKHLQKID